MGNKPVWRSLAIWAGVLLVCALILQVFGQRPERSYPTQEAYLHDRAVELGNAAVIPSEAEAGNERTASFKTKAGNVEDHILVLASGAVQIVSTNEPPTPIQSVRNAVWGVFAHPTIWLALCAPLILAAMGGFTSERSGVINIALEGKMLTAACVGYICTLLWHSPWIALAMAIVSAIVMSLLHWLLTQKYLLDHIISGMAINALAAGGTNYLYIKYTDPNANELPKLPMPFFWSLAFVLPFLLFLYSRYARGGLRLLAVGNDPEKSRLMGVQPLKVRFYGLIATGVLTGIAGAMIFTSAGQFTEGMTAGRGFIALAALILGGWRPLPALGACIAFGFFQALQLQLQGLKIAGADIPAEVFSSLPYLITVVALAGFLGRSRAPAGLGKI